MLGFSFGGVWGLAYSSILFTSRCVNILLSRVNDAHTGGYSVLMLLSCPPILISSVWRDLSALYFFSPVSLSLSFLPSLITLILFSFYLWDWIIIYYPDPSTPLSCLYLSRSHSLVCMLRHLLLSVSLFHDLLFSIFHPFFLSFQLKYPLCNLYPSSFSSLPPSNLSFLPQFLSLTLPCLSIALICNHFRSVFDQKREQIDEFVSEMMILWWLVCTQTQRMHNKWKQMTNWWQRGDKRRERGKEI